MGPFFIEFSVLGSQKKEVYALNISEGLILCLLSLSNQGSGYHLNLKTEEASACT